MGKTKRDAKYNLSEAWYKLEGVINELEQGKTIHPKDVNLVEEKLIGGKHIYNRDEWENIKYR